jgi:hypothetical protein
MSQSEPSADELQGAQQMFWLREIFLPKALDPEISFLFAYRTRTGNAYRDM